MKNVPDILEIPVGKAKSVIALAAWFEANKLHRKKHPSLSLPIAKELPPMALISLVVVVGMALAMLEDKGVLKIKQKKNNRSREDFLDLINNTEDEESLEQLIEKRYDLDLVLRSDHHPSIVSEPAAGYGLDDVFGIWKDKQNPLDKVRKDQWGKRK